MTDTLNTLAPLGQLKQMAVSNLQGKAVPTADALLSRAHRDATDRGLVLVGMRSEVILPPTGQQLLCIVKVTVQMKSLYEQGQPIYEFEGLGDADATTGNRVNGRLLALAETRARTRALGVALNSDEEASHQAPPQGAATGSYQPAAPAQVTAQATVQAAVTPSAPGQYQGFPNGVINFGKHKGKHLTDPSIPLSDLQWFLSATMPDRITPDTAKRADAQAEINRRTGGPLPGNAPVANPQSNPPVAFPQAPQPFTAVPNPAPTFTGTGVFPTSMPTNVTITPVLPNHSATGPDQATITRLAQTAAMKGYQYPAFESVVTQVFNKQINQLGALELQQLEQWLATLTVAA